MSHSFIQAMASRICPTTWSQASKLDIKNASLEENKAPKILPWRPWHPAPLQPPDSIQHKNNYKLCHLPAIRHTIVKCLCCFQTKFSSTDSVPSQGQHTPHTLESTQTATSLILCESRKPFLILSFKVHEYLLLGRKTSCFTSHLWMPSSSKK